MNVHPENSPLSKALLAWGREQKGSGWQFSFITAAFVLLEHVPEYGMEFLKTQKLNLAQQLSDIQNSCSDVSLRILLNVYRKVFQKSKVDSTPDANELVFTESLLQSINEEPVTCCLALKAINLGNMSGDAENMAYHLIVAICDQLWHTSSVENASNRGLALLAESLGTSRHLSSHKLTGSQNKIPSHDVRFDVVVSQIRSRLLASQLEDGSWNNGSHLESTANAVLALVSLQELFPHEPMHSEINRSIIRARQFLGECILRRNFPADTTNESPGSKLLEAALVISALTESRLGQNEMIYTRQQSESSSRTLETRKLLQQLLAVSEVNSWAITAALHEAEIVTPTLLSMQRRVFPQVTKDSYVVFIASIWLTVNYCHKLFVSSSIIFDMMVVSLLDFRADEFMELVAVQKDNSLLWNAYDNLKHEAEGGPGGVDSDSNLLPHDWDLLTGESSTLDDVSGVLRTFMRHVTSYRGVVAASNSERVQLKREMFCFIKAHLKQLEDNARFASQKDGHRGPIFMTPRSTYAQWLESTGSLHTSCAFSFAFFRCLLSAKFRGGKDCFGDVYQKHLAHQLCSHLAMLSRLYNDYGSVARDEDERNLNSVNFPDFKVGVRSEDSAQENARSGLLRLARWERKSAESHLSALEIELGALGADACGAEMANALKLFVYTTELFGDVYVSKDLTNRVQ